MIDFTHRSYNKELLDKVTIPFPDIAENMRELEYINSHLGGHKITLQGFKILAGNKKEFSICEIGCGGGDNLTALSNYCIKKNIDASFTGIDINAECIEFARKQSDLYRVNYIESDYKRVAFGNNKPDIIFSSLFCHHFTEEELVEMLIWMKRNAIWGFFINDLHRHPLAYHFIKLATRIFSKSYLVKNDAPLSVLRGFKKKEMTDLLNKAGIEKYTIQWKWAFRYLITVPINDNNI
jgi:2-polyprenyl-3-methyl-5-hydroxy-6-metoxy-1,4-benzoquinol methylase